MSTPTPPGWYPVPGTGQERWWDGTAWTDSHRPANRLNDAVTQSWESVQLQPTPVPVPAPRNSGRGLVVGASVGVAAVVVAAVGTAVWALQPSSGKKPAPDPVVTVAVSSPGVPSPSPSPRRSSPRPDPSPSAGAGLSLADKVHGWGVPLPDGWTAESATDKAPVVEIYGQYACGTSTSLCVRGQFAVLAEPVDADDAKAAAEHDMAAFAPEIFGTLKSHKEDAAGTLEIAGGQGWAIRWYVSPKEGASGYVVVAAVPAKDGSGYVVLHGGVDDDPKAPDPSVLDEILRGVTDET